MCLFLEGLMQRKLTVNFHVFVSKFSLRCLFWLLYCVNMFIRALRRLENLAEFNNAVPEIDRD